MKSFLKLQRTSICVTLGRFWPSRPRLCFPWIKTREKPKKHIRTPATKPTPSSSSYEGVMAASASWTAWKTLPDTKRGPKFVDNAQGGLATRKPRAAQPTLVTKRTESSLSGVSPTCAVAWELQAPAQTWCTLGTRWTKKKSSLCSL